MIDPAQDRGSVAKLTVPSNPGDTCTRKRCSGANTAGKGQARKMMQKSGGRSAIADPTTPFLVSIFSSLGGAFALRKSGGRSAIADPTTTTRFRFWLFFAAIFVFMPAVGVGTAGQSTDSSPAVEVTIKGNVLCNRATEPRDRFWDTKDGDAPPVIYAFEATPAIAEAIGKIMDAYPERGLNVEDALRIQNQFDKQLKYFVAPGPMTEKIHKAVEAGSQMLALSGR